MKKLTFIIAIALIAFLIIPSTVGAADWTTNITSKMTNKDWTLLASNITFGISGASANSTIAQANAISASSTNITAQLAASSNVSIAITAALANKTITYNDAAYNFSVTMSAASANSTIAQVNAITAASSNSTIAQVNAITAASSNSTIAQVNAITAATANVTLLSNNGTVTMTMGPGQTYPGPGVNLTIATQVFLPAGATQGLNFTLPRVGYYLVEADLRENTTATNLGGTVVTTYGLCYDPSNTIIVGTERLGGRFSQVDNETTQNRHFTWLYSNATGTPKIAICGNISSSLIYGGTIQVWSDTLGRSTLTYVGLP